jgi:hypothetical protein
MRVLDTETRKLKEFIGYPDEPYAILSHTWGNDEVVFEDLKTGASEQKAGYSKIEMSCKLAHAEGYSWIWIDTCCIDKSSSAELSETINSMFEWYQKSAVCYAYLEDVRLGTGKRLDEAALASCRWIKRGWTLQELVAPPVVKFYSADWKYCGERKGLAGALANTTKITFDILSLGAHRTLLNRYSIAQRMSWAATRQTTRPEDISYCLLGIFDVNMALLYGEGQKKAFIRLQEEILKKSTDQSILAWGCDMPDVSEVVHDELGETIGKRILYSGVLALHPSWFVGAGEVVECWTADNPFQMTNGGLRIWLPIIKDNLESQKCLAVLNCHPEADFEHQIAIPVWEVPYPNLYFYRNGDAVTISSPSLESDLTNGKGRRREIYLVGHEEWNVQDFAFTYICIEFACLFSAPDQAKCEVRPTPSGKASIWNSRTKILVLKIGGSRTERFEDVLMTAVYADGKEEDVFAVRYGRIFSEELSVELIDPFGAPNAVSGQFALVANPPCVHLWKLQHCKVTLAWNIEERMGKPIHFNKFTIEL